MPAAYNTRAEIRQIEPYVYNQSTHGKYSPRFGNSRLPWLSGSATWSFFAATQHILGIQPDYNGLTIEPCIPGNWKQFSVTRRFRNKLFHINVQNNEGKQHGIKKLILNGEELKNNFIPIEKMRDTNEVIVILG
jgi:cellobiose phosphorylase